MLKCEGLVVEYEALCDFPITRRAVQKIRPTGAFFVVTELGSSTFAAP